MIQKIYAAIGLALANIRAHFFRTILSILGIVIGVAALVAILSLIDGMEQYAQEQITSTTSLKAIVIRAASTQEVDGLTLKKDSVLSINFEDALDLQGSFKHAADVHLYASAPKMISLDDSTQLAAVTIATNQLTGKVEVVSGRVVDVEAVKRSARQAVINESLAARIREKNNLQELLGQQVYIDTLTLTIIGIVKDRLGEHAGIYFPITLLSSEAIRINPPACVVEAEKVEDVPAVKAEIESWLEDRFGVGHEFNVTTNQFRVEQAMRGIQLFRVIMGLIVGISVVVGGIGVMNVLLISVTERTMEIGVRKAVGANRRDIVLQFLGESVVISVFGSLVGLIIGVLATLAFIPIIKAITKAPFQAAFTANTLIVVSIISILIGVVFGTYPALRASRLDPVEAIRKE